MRTSVIHRFKHSSLDGIRSIKSSATMDCRDIWIRSLPKLISGQKALSAAAFWWCHRELVSQPGLSSRLCLRLSEGTSH